MVWAFWNKNAAKNISCWLCEHFQRYDVGEPGPLSNCQGECRKHPPFNQASVRNITQAADGIINGLFGFIPFANINWCNGFQASLEKSIPTVVQTRQECDDQDWADWTTPIDVYTGGPPIPRKKDILESCWYCEHFQTDIETQIPGSPCLGLCMIREPNDFDDEDFNTGTGVNRIDFAYGPARLQFSAWYWCSKWERSRDPVDPPPEFNGVPCETGIP